MGEKRAGGLFNARDFGLAGTGGIETRAIQETIDACSEAGGGTVLVPAGRYISGTIFLRSNINLHLSAGALLVGSPRRRDYNADDVFPENAVFPERVSGAHLLIAYRQENVSITGTGVIDGNSPAFLGGMHENSGAPNYRFNKVRYPIKDWRPGQMVFFCLCRNINVQDVTLRDSPYWTLFLHGCNDAHIRGLTIENPPATPNGDGIDIDCCRNVDVSGCIIRSGDDCITLRADSKPLGRLSQPCENITVSNCVLSTPKCAIRVGVGDGQIRRCAASNIVVAEARNAVVMNCIYSGELFEHGACIEQVHFSDFVINSCRALVLAVGPEASRPACIRDVSFSRFHAQVSAGSMVAGTSEVPVERVELSDFNFYVVEEQVPGETSPGSLYGHYTGNAERPLPCVLYGIQLREAVFNNVCIRWDKRSEVLREGLFLSASRGVILRNLAYHHHPRGASAVICEACERVELTGCRAGEGADVFLRMGESISESSMFNSGNDFPGPAKPAGQLPGRKKQGRAQR